MKRTKENKAITLVALVVTIVILLILAGVSINLILGDSGIISKTKEAKRKTEDARENEDYILDEIGNSIEYSEALSLEPWSGTVATSFASGDGTEANPYTIENGEQLAYLASLVNAGDNFDGKYVSITSSINLGEKEFKPIALGYEGSRTEKEWNMTKEFDGTLNGNGHVIAGVKISQRWVNGVGIIGVLGENGVVENLKTYNGTVIGRTCVGGIVGAGKGKVINCVNNLEIIAQDGELLINSGSMAGGIIGWAPKGTIENCINNGTITGKDESAGSRKGMHVGGIVGYSDTEGELLINNCANNGNVTAGFQLVGGIIGGALEANQKLTITKCINRGKITTDDNSLENIGVGGILGYSDCLTEIGECTNYGEVISVESWASGIAGYIANGTVNNCKNNGNISAGVRQAAGMVAYLKQGKVSNCSNYGAVMADSQQAAGMVGCAINGEIENCENSGEITTNGYVAGGIIGWVNTNASIKGCNNSGNVLASRYAGGIVGNSKDGTISYCVNKGKVKSTEQITGGIVGYIENGKVENCKNTAEISTVGVAGGISGWLYSNANIKNCQNDGMIIATSAQAAGIVAQTRAGTITDCINTGKIVSESKDNYDGISGGIVAWQRGGTISNTFNSGEIVAEKIKDESFEIAGGIVGESDQGAISKSYNRGTITCETMAGGIIGQKHLATTIENTYYYTTQDIKGIGSESDTNTEIKPVDDVSGKTEKTTKNLGSLEEFLNTTMP